MAYLTTQGTKFMLNGARHVLFGATIYGGWSTAYLDSQFADAVATGLNYFRLVNWMPVAVGTDEYLESRMVIMDYAMDKARQAGMKIEIDCSDFFNILRVRYSSSESTARMSSQNATDAWRPWLTFLMNRVNTINGQTYKTDDVFAIIVPGGEWQTLYNGVLPAFIAYFTQLVKELAPTKLCGSGGIENGTHPWETIINIPTCDFACTHPYGYEVIGAAIRTEFGDFNTISVAANKPWYIEEEGFQVVHGDDKVAALFKSVIGSAFDNNCSGFTFWNFYAAAADSPDAYNIGPVVLPKAWETIAQHACSKTRIIRIPVDVYDKVQTLKTTKPYYYNGTPYTQFR